MPSPFGSPYRARRLNRLRGAQLAPVRVRRAEAGQPIALAPTPTRRGCLEAIAAGKVRWFPSAGWRCAGKAVNAVVRDVVSAGWAVESLDGDRRTIALTNAGRAVIGAGEAV